MGKSEYALSHRGRPLRNLSEIQLAALLLEWAGTPPLESQELARDLLEDLGSLAGVLSAPAAKLTQYPGLSDAARTLLRFYAALMGRYLADRARQVQRLDTYEEVYQVLLPYYCNQPVEQVHALFTDREGRYLGSYLAAQGSEATVQLSYNHIYAQALERNAYGIILAHNHPDGTPLFSQRDVESTLHLARTLAKSQVELRDHYLFAGLRMYSLRESYPKALGGPWPTS